LKATWARAWICPSRFILKRAAREGEREEGRDGLVVWYRGREGRRKGRKKGGGEEGGRPTFIAHVGADAISTVSQEGSHVVHFPRVPTLDKEPDPRALLCLEEVLMDGTHGEHGWNGKTVGTSQAVWGREGGVSGRYVGRRERRRKGRREGGKDVPERMRSWLLSPSPIVRLSAACSQSSSKASYTAGREGGREGGREVENVRGYVLLSL